MKNVLKLSNDVNVYLTDDNNVYITSNSVKILLNSYGNLISLDNRKGETNITTGRLGMTLKERMLTEDKKVVVANFLQEIGVPPHLLGYSYLKTAIILAYDDETYLKAIVRGLYMEVARIHNTTPNRAERAMRHAIEVVWNRGDTDLLDELFGSTISPERGKATNSEFISTIVEKLTNG